MPPSLTHEVLVALFREKPELLATLLGTVLGDQLAGEDLSLTDASFAQIAPAEFFADLAILVGKPLRLGIIVEVQLSRDKKKRYSWPLYASALRARWKCPTVVLVIAPHRGIARWAARPIATGPNGNVFRPMVVGPSGVPWVTTEAAARAAPELGVLSALAHGNAPGGKPVLKAMLAGLLVLPDDAAKIYYDIVRDRMIGEAKRALEEAMHKGGYKYQSDFARKYVAEGFAEGLAKGRVQETLRVVLRQLARQVGLLGQELQARVEALPPARLDELADALLDFNAMADLVAWLEAGAER